FTRLKKSKKPSSLIILSANKSQKSGINYMHSPCGKSADRLRIAGSKDCVHSSTECHKQESQQVSMCVEGGVIRAFIQVLHPHSSTALFCISPLIEHTFYPVSTASIIKTTKLIS